MPVPTRIFHTVIIGGGPGGMAPLLAAHRTGRIERLLGDGVAVVERGAGLGGGSLGSYAINSDSSGQTFADCLEGPGTSELTSLRDHPLARQMRAAGDGTVPLTDAARFLDLVGGALTRMIERSAASVAYTHHTARWIRRVRGGWSVSVAGREDGEKTLLARNVVIAAGGHQPSQRLDRETVGGINLKQRCGSRLLQSGEVVTPGGLDRIDALLRGKPSPRVAIVGGSTSAVAVAHALLNRLPNARFGAGGITVLHRRPLRIFYLDRQAAREEGYDEWTEDDVCPVSGRVFRFAGFRLDSRELVMQARGICGRPPEPRLRLHQLGEQDTGVGPILDGADLVIAAMGYRPRALPVLDRDGSELVLLARTGPQEPLVDRQCRVLDAQRQPLANLFGIGLAAGFRPDGPLGGEASFQGQQNGLWLWQHDVGSIIVDALRRDRAQADRSSIERFERRASGGRHRSPASRSTMAAIAGEKQ